MSDVKNAMLLGAVATLMCVVSYSIGKNNADGWYKDHENYRVVSVPAGAMNGDAQCEFGPSPIEKIVYPNKPSLLLTCSIVQRDSQP